MRAVKNAVNLVQKGCACESTRALLIVTVGMDRGLVNLLFLIARRAGNWPACRAQECLWTFWNRT